MPADAVVLGFKVGELIEKGLITEDDLFRLRNWQSSTDLPQLTDEQLAGFFCSSNGNHVQCTKIIEVYFKHKIRCGTLFNNRNVNSLSGIANFANFAVMPKRYQGSTVVICGFKDTNYKNFDFEGCLKMAGMILESIIYDGVSHEVIHLVDSRGASLMHLVKVKMSLLLVYLDYFQCGLPLKMKFGHFLNANRITYCAFRMIKPFLSQELSSRIAFHSESENFDNFHQKCVPKRYLPKEYGGDLDSISIYQQKTLEKLNDLQVYFDAEEQQRNKFSK